MIASSTPITKVEFDKNSFEGITRDSRSGVYDLICCDEAGNTFIVEMQMSKFPHILQRLKFYGFQKFNTLIRKGDFDYGNLPKIYCIGIMAKGKSALKGYHHTGLIRTADGEIMDAQMKFVLVELKKFNKKPEHCTSDLDKLIYTMKMLDEQTVEKEIQYPQFWTEEWLKIAIQELDTRAMSPEKRMAYEIVLANNAEAVRQEKAKILQSEIKGKIKGKIEGKIENQKETAQRMIAEGFDDSTIARVINESLSFVQALRNESTNT